MVKTDKDDEGEKCTDKDEIICLLKKQILKKLVWFLENGALQ